MGAYARRLITAAVLTFSLLPTVVRADDPVPDAETIRAKVRAASPAPPGFRETTVTVGSNGLTRTIRRVERGDDWRDSDERGPFFYDESGEVKGQAWHQNDNGQTSTTTPIPARPNPTRPRRRSRAYTSRSTYAVADSMYAAGVFGDPVTWHVVRRELLGRAAT